MYMYIYIIVPVYTCSRDVSVGGAQGRQVRVWGMAVGEVIVMMGVSQHKDL